MVNQYYTNPLWGNDLRLNNIRFEDRKLKKKKFDVRSCVSSAWPLIFMHFQECDWPLPSVALIVIINANQNSETGSWFTSEFWETARYRISVTKVSWLFYNIFVPQNMKFPVSHLLFLVGVFIFKNHIKAVDYPKNVTSIFRLRKLTHHDR